MGAIFVPKTINILKILDQNVQNKKNINFLEQKKLFLMVLIPCRLNLLELLISIKKGETMDANIVIEMIDRHMASQFFVLNVLGCILKETKNISAEMEIIQNDLKKITANKIEWAPLSMISEKNGLTKDAVRKQLQNGDFEEGVDFKFDGNKIVVHQGAIGRLQRKRRSANG